jgi:hypothetical protein
MRLSDTRQLKTYKVVVGKVPSLNAFYASRHWTVRKKAKDLHCDEVLAQLYTFDCVPITDVHITCLVNYRYDVDNSIMAVKFALDAFKKWGAIRDDSPKYVKQIKLVHSEAIAKDTAEIIFEGVIVE